MADKTAPSPKPPSRVYEQIESTADLFPPGVYDLLTFQTASWRSSSDPLSSDFIPLTSVPLRTSADAKMFVIGVLPPAANVTGRLLDRSASVASIQGYAEPIDLAGDVTSSSTPGSPAASPSNGYIVTAPGYQFTPAVGKVTLGVPAGPGAVGQDMESPAISGHSHTEMYDLFHDAYVALFHKEPTPTELLFAVAQSKREAGGPGGGAWPNNNPGFIGNFTKPHPGTFHANGKDTNGNSNTSAGNTGAYFNTYPTPQAGAAAFIRHALGNPNARQAAAAGDIMGYLTSLAQSNYFGESVNVYYEGAGGFPALLKEAASSVTQAGGPRWDLGTLPKKGPDSCAFNEGMKDYRKRIGWTKDYLEGKLAPTPALKASNPNGRFLRDSPYGDACPLAGDPPVDPNATPSSWAGQGTAAAQEAQKAQSKLADKDLNQTALGQQLQGAQKDYIRALQIAIQQMASTPPLRMLVNPVSFKVGEEKIVADGSFGRNGPIVEHWGEQQTKITASGKLAGFYALDVGSSLAAGAGFSPGLTRSARAFSQSYQNFLSLYLLYRNNAGIWLEDFTKQYPQANHLAMVGSIYIYYDDVLYIGSFDSFNMNETDDKPFTLEYDYSFTVRAKFELDRVPDPREKYGASGVFAGPLTINTGTEVTMPVPDAPVSASDQAFVDKAKAQIQAQEAARVEKARIEVDSIFDPPFLPDKPTKGPPTTDESILALITPKTNKPPVRNRK